MKDFQWVKIYNYSDTPTYSFMLRFCELEGGKHEQGADILAQIKNVILFIDHF